MNTILTQCHQAEAGFIDLWQRLVNIDSGSGYIPGLRAVGEETETFMQNLGLATRRHPAADGSFQVTGQWRGHGTKSILLLAHLDTVFPPGTAKQRPFAMDEAWAYGPGVSDCKGGVVMALYAVWVLQALDIRSFKQLTLCFNSDEEISSPASRELIMELAKQHDWVLSLEPGGMDDSVVEWRKGTAKLQLTVQGKAAHAGSAPESGCNALMELAFQLTKLNNSLGCPALGTTVTFTTAKAGDRMNVVPDYAEAWADVRVTTLEELDRVEQAAQQAVQEVWVPGTQAAVKLLRQKPPFAPRSATRQLVEQAETIYRELGRTLRSGGAGGASDINWAAMASQAIMLDSLGPVKGGPNHTVEEKTRLDSIVPRLYLLVRLIEELGQA